jgi:hypothetical protein
MAVYTTSRGRTYEFSFVPQPDGSIRPYIVRQPSYGSRDSSCTATHRLYDGSRPYICFTGKLRTTKEAAAVAEAWAKRTDVYIDSGDAGVWKLK